MSRRPHDFVGWYRLVTITGAMAWHAYLGWPLARPWLSLVPPLAIAMLPVVALAALAHWINNRWVLVAAAVAHALLVAYASRVVFSGDSSTDAVALLVVPLLSSVTIVPGAVVAAWVGRWLKERRERSLRESG